MKKSLLLSIVFLSVVSACFAGKGKSGSPVVTSEFETQRRNNREGWISPTFNGKKNFQKEFQKWLEQNIRYPSDVRSLALEGTVRVTFVLDQQGKITDVEILTSPHPSFTFEVLRLLDASPDWTPGYNPDLEPVKIRMNVPVKFVLPKNRGYPDSGPRRNRSGAW